MTDNVIEFSAGSFIGLLTWFFGGLDGLIQVLLVFCVIDYITGMCAACFERKLSSEIGFKGIARKCTMFMFVGMAHLIDKYLPGDTGSLRATVCIFYILNESVSIFENAERMGVKLPKPLHNILLKLNNFEGSDKQKISLEKLRE